RFDGDRRVISEWERALPPPPWDGPPTWHHGDLDCRNWLVQDRRISGVVGWGSVGGGGPARGGRGGRGVPSPQALGRVRGAGRAGGGAVSEAVAALSSYTPQNTPSLYHEAETWLSLVFSDGG